MPLSGNITLAPALVILPKVGQKCLSGTEFSLWARVGDPCPHWRLVTLEGEKETIHRGI